MVNFQESGQQIHYNYQHAGGSRPPSQVQRFIVLGGILVGVIILIIVFFSLLGGSNDGPQQQLGRIVARQERILTLIDTYGENTRGLNEQTEVAIIKASVTSDLQQLQAIGGASSAEALQSISDSTIEERLDSAAASTNFDETFLEILKDQLSANVSEIEALFNSTDNQQLKSALDAAYLNEKQVSN